MSVVCTVLDQGLSAGLLAGSNTEGAHDSSSLTWPSFHQARYETKSASCRNNKVALKPREFVIHTNHTNHTNHRNHTDKMYKENRQFLHLHQHYWDLFRPYPHLLWNTIPFDGSVHHLDPSSQRDSPVRRVQYGPPVSIDFSIFTNDLLIKDYCYTCSSAGSPRNVQRVETDLEKSTQSVHILPLLKAFLAEVLLECKNTDTKDDPEFLKGVLKESNKLFSQMLRDAIDFCNDQKNKNRAKLLKNLDD